MKLIKVIRRFFDEKDFWEVETPALQICPAMDAHLHGFKTTLLGVDLQRERDLYLHTSPELAMKKLLVAGLPRIYQIAHVFRNGEGSRLHSPEFTMLEWYRAQAGYRDIMDDCVDLLRYVAKALGIQTYAYGGKSCDPFGDWQRITVTGAFEKYAGIDLEKFLTLSLNPSPLRERESERREQGEGVIKAFAKEITSKGIRVAEGDCWDDLFFRVMAEKVEPHLGMDAPCILYDYPVSMASLSRQKPEDPRFAERFEVYVCGVELANAFGELTDAAEQRRRFQAEMDVKEQLYGTRYPVDEDFMAALEHGLPDSGGIALGIDRLVMLATGAEDIEQVLWTGGIQTAPSLR